MREKVSESNYITPAPLSAVKRNYATLPGKPCEFREVLVNFCAYLKCQFNNSCKIISFKKYVSIFNWGN